MNTSDPPPPSHPPSPLRRAALFGGAALLATTAGAWLALQRRPAGAPATDEAAALWARSFDTPQDGVLHAADWRGQPLVLNFWATWCAPCVREFPQLERFHREFSPKGWQTVGLAIDTDPAPVREFLKKLPVSFHLGLAGLSGLELAKQLGNERGGLPFTVVFDDKARVLQRKLGETSFDELAGWATMTGR
ncbi:MAG: hypothetical protein RLZZ598_1772 [Pseudomonadota bacterium]|jgi:thiol-disulfide isomerase/thioredoxin